MKTYEVKLKMKLPNYPKWIIAHIEEGLEQGEAVVEYDITKDKEKSDDWIHRHSRSHETQDKRRKGKEEVHFRSSF